MNKKRIDKMIPIAYKELENSEITDNGKIKKTYRSAVSSFGAAVTMGSLVAASAFFADEKKGEISRKNLSDVIFNVVKKEIEINTDKETLYDYVEANNNASTKEIVLDAVVAIKLAMNLYTLT